MRNKETKRKEFTSLAIQLIWRGALDWDNQIAQSRALHLTLGSAFSLTRVGSNGIDQAAAFF